jgi:hypothetical protein
MQNITHLPALRTVLGLLTEAIKDPARYILLLRKHEEALSEFKDVVSSIDLILRMLQEDVESGTFSITKCKTIESAF